MATLSLKGRESTALPELRTTRFEGRACIPKATMTWCACGCGPWYNGPVQVNYFPNAATIFLCTDALLHSPGLEYVCLQPRNGKRTLRPLQNPSKTTVARNLQIALLFFLRLNCLFYFPFSSIASKGFPVIFIISPQIAP